MHPSSSASWMYKNRWRNRNYPSTLGILLAVAKAIHYGPRLVTVSNAIRRKLLTSFVILHLATYTSRTLKAENLQRWDSQKNHPGERAELLKKEQYATATDRKTKKQARFEKDAGKREFAIHSLLECYQKTVAYEKYKGQMVECRKVFSCPLEIASKAFDAVTRALLFLRAALHKLSSTTARF